MINSFGSHVRRNLIAYLALFLALGGTTYAATGGNFILGERNSASSRTLLSAPIAGKALQLTNNDSASGATALGLNVASGHPPFTVNSATKVPNLNAANAGTVGGLRVQKFSAKPAPGTPLTPLKTVGTVRLDVGCGGQGRPLFTVVPAPGAPPQGARASIVLNGNAGDTTNNTTGKCQGTLPVSGIVILDGTENSVGANGTIEAATTAGKVTTIQWAARSTSNIPTPNPDEFDCFFYGTAISG